MIASIVIRVVTVTIAERDCATTAPTFEKARFFVLPLGRQWPGLMMGRNSERHDFPGLQFKNMKGALYVMSVQAHFHEICLEVLMYTLYPKRLSLLLADIT